MMCRRLRKSGARRLPYRENQSSKKEAPPRRAGIFYTRSRLSASQYRCRRDSNPVRLTRGKSKTGPVRQTLTPLGFAHRAGFAPLSAVVLYLSIGDRRSERIYEGRFFEMARFSPESVAFLLRMRRKANRKLLPGAISVTAKRVSVIGLLFDQKKG